MPIETVIMDKVSCKRCGKYILVEYWRDAAAQGWCVPIDGHLQLCPKCDSLDKAEIFAGAGRAGANARDLDVTDKLEALARHLAKGGLAHSALIAGLAREEILLLRHREDKAQAQGKEEREAQEATRPPADLEDIF